MSQWISDYTPSIQDMRETYEETWFYAPHTNSVKEKNAEFDRFLELVFQVERERIIKLVELQSFIWMGEKQLIQISKDELINLIKEETE